MTRVLITDTGSYVGESVRKYIQEKDTNFEIDTVDIMYVFDQIHLVLDFKWIYLLEKNEKIFYPNE